MVYLPATVVSEAVTTRGFTLQPTRSCRAPCHHQGALRQGQGTQHHRFEVCHVPGLPASGLSGVPLRPVTTRLSRHLWTQRGHGRCAVSRCAQFHPQWAVGAPAIAPTPWRGVPGLLNQCARLGFAPRRGLQPSCVRLASHRAGTAIACGAAWSAFHRHRCTPAPATRFALT